MKYQLSALLLVGSAAAQWTNYAYEGGLNFMDELFDPPVAPLTSYTKSLWGSSHIPKACHDKLGGTGEGKCSDAAIEVYNVTYSDCTRPWVLCKCGDGETIDFFADQFGRMPVKLRSQIRHGILESPIGAGCSGGTASDGDLIIFGAGCGMPTFIHEAGHIVDHYGDVFEEDWSSKTTFTTAVAADSCITTPDNVGAYHEVFAQESVLVVYFLKTGTLPATTDPADTGCWVNQFNAIVNKFGNSHFRYGGTCPNTRPADSEKITRDLSRRSMRVVRKSASGYSPKYNPKYGKCKI